MAGRDVKIDQLRVQKIIVSGGTLLVYDETSAADINGAIDPAKFSLSGVGSDVSTYLSGVIGSIGTITRGTAVVGGDFVVSGNTRAIGNVNIEGNLTVNGATPGGAGFSPTPVSTADVVSSSLASSTGSSIYAARVDHNHYHGTLPGGNLHSLASTVSAGFMSAQDKTDLLAVKSNQVSLSTGSATTVSAGSSTVGTSSFAAHADHVHSHGNLTGGSLHSIATTSVAGFMSSTDKTKLNGIADNATNVQFADSIPFSIGTAVPGTGSTAARHDHVHAHGNQVGGTLHALVTTAGTGSAGFMSVADKTKLDSLPSSFNTSNFMTTDTPRTIWLSPNEFMRTTGGTLGTPTFEMVFGAGQLGPWGIAIPSLTNNHFTANFGRPSDVRTDTSIFVEFFFASATTGSRSIEAGVQCNKNSGFPQLYAFDTGMLKPATLTFSNPSEIVKYQFEVDNGGNTDFEHMTIVFGAIDPSQKFHFLGANVRYQKNS